MKRSRFLGIALIAAVFCACQSCLNAFGYWLQDVAVLPTNPVKADSEVKLHITVFTPSMPSRLYQQTEVTFSKEFNKFLIKVYPDSGVLKSIGVLYETVSLGRLPLGEFLYEVQIHPRSLGGTTGDYRIKFGSFSVVPELKHDRQGTNLILRWPSEAIRYRLESTATPVDPRSWRYVQNFGVVVGSERMVTLNLGADTQFFRLTQDRITFP